MGLNWEIESDGDTRRRRLLAYPPSKRDDGEYLNGITNGIIWGAMHTDVGTLTGETVREYWARLATVSEVVGPLLVDGNGNPYHITPRDVIAHIGLRTNVFPQTSEPKFVERYANAPGQTRAGVRKILHAKREEFDRLLAESVLPDTCSWNAGGDPAGGCSESTVGNTDLCLDHHVAEKALTSW